jgi:hypothetical protein
LAYYFIDRYNLDDPYPVGFGGATVPGPSGAYDAVSNGTDQVIVLRDTKTLGASMVNEADCRYTRLHNTRLFFSGHHAPLSSFASRFRYPK